MVDYKDWAAQHMPLFRGIESKIAVLDKHYVCIRSNDIICKGDYLISFVQEGIPSGLDKFKLVSLKVREKYYCCRLMPVPNSGGEVTAYLAETISLEDLIPYAERADLPTSVLPMFSSLEYNIGKLWKASSVIKKQIEDISELSALTTIESSIANISVICRNAFEYVNILHPSIPANVVCMGDMLRMLDKKCNKTLGKCGRKISFSIQVEDLNVRVNLHRMTVALMNAIQNALLYSPKDSIPLVNVKRISAGDRHFIEVQVINENIMRTDKDFKNNLNIEFSFRHLGFGIPIIKRFAYENGGTFKMTEQDDKVILTLTLPGVIPSNSNIVRFDSPGMEYYNSTTPDYIELMIMDVVNFFGENDRVIL